MDQLQTQQKCWFIWSTHIQDGCLSSARGSHRHHAVPNDHGLIELRDLDEGARLRLQPLLHDDVVDGVVHHSIVLLRQYHARKQIVYNTLQMVYRENISSIKDHSRAGV